MAEHPLTDLAWEVHSLLNDAEARDQFRNQCTMYLSLRKQDPQRPPPLPFDVDDDLREEDKPALLSCERYAILSALHEAVCHQELPVNPAPWPEATRVPTVPDDPPIPVDPFIWQILVKHASRLEIAHRWNVEACLEFVRNNLTQSQRRAVLASCDDQTKISIQEQTEARPLNSIRLVGSVWHLHFGEEAGQYPSNKCLGWLAKVLVRPKRPHSVADLLGDLEGKIAGDTMLRGEIETDIDGIRAIKNRIAEIEAITAATGSTMTLEEELQYLLNQLQSGRDGKHFVTEVQRSHHNLSTQLRRFMTQLVKTHMPILAAHLKAAVRLDFPAIIYSPPHGTSSWQS